MTAKSIKELIATYEVNSSKRICEKISFSGVGNKDVYNITAPFEDEGEKVIAGRVESRDSENSKVMFFIKEGSNWIPRKNTREFTLQDPFITRIEGELIFGGVETYSHPTIKGALGYKTNFYRGKSINTLTKFAEGPQMMKDIRLVELPKGDVGVFTRPQGEIGGRGKIGFIKLHSLEELNAETINKARLLENQFIDEEWGGTNELHVLSNGNIGVLGHIACFDEEGNRHYYSMAFIFDTGKEQASDIKIIAMRRELLSGESKRPDLVDVLFSGGVVRKGNGEAELYVGVSDAEAQKVIIEDPFTE